MVYYNYSSRKKVDIGMVYKGIKLDIMRCKLSVDLIPLQLHSFDVILGID